MLWNLWIIVERCTICPIGQSTGTCSNPTTHMSICIEQKGSCSIMEIEILRQGFSLSLWQNQGTRAIGVRKRQK